jgi:hypothetical protein
MLKREDVGDMQVPGEGRKVVRIIAQSRFDVNEENREIAVLVDSCERKSSRFTSPEEGCASCSTAKFSGPCGEKN